jgi:hypothetical protein
LPCIRIGRRVLFRLEALEEWARKLEGSDDVPSHMIVYHA